MALRRRGRPGPEPELAALVSITSTSDVLTAAASRVTESDARRLRNATMYGWQLRALAYSESLGVIWYAAKFYERSLRNLILIVQRKGDDGSWAKVDDPIPNEQLATLVDKNGEQSALLGMYGRQVFLTGEARLLGTVDPDLLTTVWEMLSVEEIHVNDQGEYIRRRTPVDQPEIIQAAPLTVFEPTGDAAVMYRLWTPSARYSDVADSPMRGVLDICDELLLLTRKMRGDITSRLSNNGLMGIPSELQLPYSQQHSRPDEDPGADNLMARLTAAMQTGIQDEQSAASQIPIIIRGPGDLLEKIIHVRFDKPLGEDADKRDELIKRLAIELDMPPEALLGIGDTNHWGAWQIDESSWKVHIQPVAQTLVENLTASWFRPLTKDPTLRIWYDESEVVNHPDRSTDYKDGFDRFVISAEAYARSIGAEEDEMMGPEEQTRQADLRALAKRGTEATAQPSSTSGAAAQTDAAGVTPAGPGATQPGKPATPGATPAPPSATVPPRAIAAGASVDRLLAGAESAVWRCREIAGSRLRSKVDRAEYATTANISLARAVFRTGGASWDETEATKLVAGGGALFAHVMETWGVPPELAQQIIAASEAHAAATLFDSSPGELPDDVLALCMIGSLSGEPD